MYYVHTFNGVGALYNLELRKMILEFTLHIR